MFIPYDWVREEQTRLDVGVTIFLCRVMGRNWRNSMQEWETQLLEQQAQEAGLQNLGAENGF